MSHIVIYPYGKEKESAVERYRRRILFLRRQLGDDDEEEDEEELKKDDDGDSAQSTENIASSRASIQENDPFPESDRA